MDDQTLSTINVDQLNQAVNNIIAAGQQQQQASCSTLPVTSSTPVGSLSALPQGLTLASLSHMPTINLNQIANLPQILNLLPVSENGKQGVVPSPTITDTRNITLPTVNQPTAENQPIQQQLSALTIPLSRIIQAKDLQPMQLPVMVPNQQLNVNQTQQQALQLHPQGQNVLQQAGHPAIHQSGQTILHQAGEAVIQQAGQTILQQSGQTLLQQSAQTILQQSGQPILQPTSQTVIQQPVQLGTQQSGQTVIQASDLPVLTAKSLQQVLQQLGNMNNLLPNNQTVFDNGNMNNAVFTVLSSGLQLPQGAEALQSSAPLMILPTTTNATQTPVTSNTAAVPSSTATLLHDILPEGTTVQDVVISVDGQDKENLTNDQSNQENSSALAPLSVLELILKSNGANHPEVADQMPVDEHDLSIVKSEVKIEGIYCVDCNTKYIDTCPHHGKDYQIISDSPMLSKARMSVPYELQLKPSLVNESTTGVFARQDLKSRVIFGPLEGVTNDVTGEEDKTDLSLWRIFEDNYCTKILYGHDESVANWMPFVQRARNSKEQNLVAYQQNHQIYFVTCKPVDAGTELLLWYAMDYAGCLGIAVNVDDMSKCNTCQKQFPTETDMKQHRKYSHPDMSLRKWKCQWCPKAFQTSGKLQIHLLSHMGVKPHKCQYCQKQFTDLSNLRVHTLLHTGEKRFSCDVCGRAFTQKAHLQSHMVCHTKEKKFSCPYCDATFGRRTDLRAHEFKHTKERVFTCVHCTKAFFSRHSYKRHMKSHTGQKDYPCNLCDKAFITKYHLTRHTKSCKGPVITAAEEPVKRRRRRAKTSVKS